MIGKSFLRREGHAKLTGKALYIDDLQFPDMLHGVTVRSEISRGRIRKIEFQPGVPWDEITVVTAEDVPGDNQLALIMKDQPFLAKKEVNHPFEPILLLAHRDPHVVQKARTLVAIDYEELPGVFHLEDSLAKREIIWGKDNVFKSYLVEKGQVDGVWKDAHHVQEGVYHTGAQEQLYIENNGMIAVASEKEGVTVWGSMQCPYYVHKALMPLFGLPADKVRIIQAETGGGFGGKEEYPSLIAGHAALLAWKSGKPVKIIYDRSEDMCSTTKRHPSRTQIRSAWSKEGKLLGLEIDFTLDGGAYATLSSVVLSRGTIHAAGPYRCDHTRIRAQAVATNTPPHGAFRGFGAPQSIFGLERHLDEVARELGITPVEIRQRNFIRKGETTATGQTIHEDVRMDKILQRALELSNYQEKLARFQKENPNSPIKRGMGIASFMHGAGFTGSGEKNLASVVGIQATEKGEVEILSASTEIGQGTNTIFSQIASQVLQIPMEQIRVVQPDTANVPDSGPTVASRTCMVVGKLVETAAETLKQTLIGAGFLPSPYTPKQFSEACRKYHDVHGTLKCLEQYVQPANVHWDDEKYQGDAYATYAWATYVAEVEVDTRTYATRVKDFVALQEVGKVVNPTLATGQIEGGVAQAVGYAIYEKVVWEKGKMLNPQMTNYIMPTASDVPEIRVEFLEENFQHGPSGAKGIGELPMDGPAPAILNAVQNALGLPVNTIPLLPEDLFAVMESET